MNKILALCVASFLCACATSDETTKTWQSAYDKKHKQVKDTVKKPRNTVDVVSSASEEW